MLNCLQTDTEDDHPSWQTGEWTIPWTQSLVMTLHKKGNQQQCQNYRAISLISHSSKVMLKTILNRFKPKAEKIIVEEQAGFRAGRSSTKQIFNLKILCEKYHQHQQDLYHVFMDFKKAFDRGWHPALSESLNNLYDLATNAVFFNGSICGAGSE